MTLTRSRLELSRDQILAFRQISGGLDRRRPWSPESLRLAAWAGLQDSVPRAALLSIHARVSDAQSNAWESSSLVQFWGPRFSAYVVAAEDRAVFSLGRLSQDPKARRYAQDLATRLEDFLAGRRMSYSQAGHALGIHPNLLRYAATTGRLLMRWDGAGRPVVWTVPAPEVDPQEARLELLRRYLHVLGPSTAAGFASWAGIRPAPARTTFAALEPEVVACRTPIGEGWILATDEEAFREARSEATGGVRLLPSGDAYYLLRGPERPLLVPNGKDQLELWTSRVWPGALLLNGEIVGTWRRSDWRVSIGTWRPLTGNDRNAVETEAASLPLPGDGSVSIAWGAWPTV